MRRILTTISANTLEALARRLNRSEISQEDIQLIAPEGKGYTALAWVNAYTGTLHAEYYNADGEWVHETTAFEDFFSGPLTASSKIEARKIALEEWQNHWWNEDAENKSSSNGWTEYDGETILGNYWVEIDN